MNRKGKTWIVRRLAARANWQAVLLSSAVLSFCAPLAAQVAQATQDQQPAQLARQIRDAVTQLQDFRQQRLGEQREHERLADELQQQVARLEADLAQSQAMVVQNEQRLASLQEELSALRTNAQQVTAQLEETVNAARTTASAMHGRLTTAIPSLRALAPQLERIINRLQSQHAAGRAEALADLYTFASDQLRRHREIDLDNRLIELPGSDLAAHAYVLRLGSINEIYVSEDGRELGIAARNAAQPWATDLSGSHRRQLLEVLSIVRQQTGAHIAAVPTVVQDEEARK